jgi:hypothetical protein
MPLLIRYCTTAMARAADSSQLVRLRVDRAHVGVAVDAQHPGDVLRDLPVSSSSAAASLSSSARPSGLSTAWPVSKNTSDWNTKRSPTMRMSGGCRGCRAAARRSRSGSATVPARAAPARRSAAGRGRRCGTALPCPSSRRHFERLFQRAELAAQRRDLLVEHLDLRQRARA